MQPDLPQGRPGFFIGREPDRQPGAGDASAVSKAAGCAGAAALRRIFQQIFDRFSISHTDFLGAVKYRRDRRAPARLSLDPIALLLALPFFSQNAYKDKGHHKNGKRRQHTE